jgi:hypothetical protein
LENPWKVAHSSRNPLNFLAAGNPSHGRGRRFNPYSARPVAGANVNHFKTFDDEELWQMVPYFRKPSKKKRSSGRHLVATYGCQDLGWMRSDPKLILDHLEGFDSGDVTAQHYNADPELRKKREMMSAWVAWLEEQERQAVAADPSLLDYEAIAEQVYRLRYGDDAWKAALKRQLPSYCAEQPTNKELSSLRQLSIGSD